MLFALMALMFSNVHAMDERSYRVDPTMNLNAIHSIHCQTKDGEEYIGTGWLIAKNTIATANHIAAGEHCVDQTTKVPLHMYKQDVNHDFALMVGKEPDDEPYLKYTCKRPTPGKVYVSYGITSYGYDWGHLLFRNNAIVATKHVIKDDAEVTDLPHSKGMRVYWGPIAPGMSGGPVVDPLTGYAYALNNAGSNTTSLLYDLADTPLCQ